MSGLDKISELQHQLDLLRAEVEKQRIAYVIVLKNDEAEKEEKEEKESKSTNKRWRAKKEDMYWFVDSDGKPTWWHEQSRNIDDFYYDTNNYFRTEQEAQRYADVLEIERQLKKFADYHNDVIDWSNSLAKYRLSYNYDTQSISIDSAWARREPRVIYFSSRKIAQQAIDGIGKEKIKDYLTYKW